MPDKPALKAVVFDFDGVIADSRRLNIHMLQALFREIGYRIPTDEAILKCYSLTLKESIQKLAQTTYSEAQRIWEFAQTDSYTDKFLDPSLCKFPKNLNDILAGLQNNYSLSIASGRTRGGIHAILQHINAARFFDTIIGFEDYANPKPHPEPLQLTLAKLRMRPNEAVYVGDSPADIKAAQAAEMPIIHVSENPSIEATVSIKSFNAIEKAIKRIASLVS